MAFFGTANGSFPGRCGKSFDLILSRVTKANQLEVLSKKKNRKERLYWYKKSVLKFFSIMAKYPNGPYFDSRL